MLVPLLGAFGVIALIGTLLYAFRPKGPKRNTSSPAPLERSALKFDDQRIQYTHPSGKIEEVKWEELRAVIIETTDQGPAVCDVFWILVGSRSGCVIPQEEKNSSALLERLQQLPGFDNEILIKAMGSTTNQRFLCWERKG